VGDVPDLNDLDQRIVAGGADVRALFATRIGDPRSISKLVIGT
jgi:hypothetical protein